MKRSMLAILVAFVLVWMGTREAADTQATASESRDEGADARKLDSWMTKKLTYSENILGGLAKGDFDAIDENARRMIALGKLEGFVRRRVKGYRAQLNAFEFANQELRRQSDKENIQGALLAFHHLTASCVSCHIRLREPSSVEAIGKQTRSLRETSTK